MSKLIVTDFHGMECGKFEDFSEAVQFAKRYAAEHDTYTNVIIYEDDYSECLCSFDRYGDYIEYEDDDDEEEEDYDEPYDPFDEVGYDPYLGGYDPDC